MANYRTARIIPIALTLIIIAIAIAALVSLARLFFFSSSTMTASQVNTTKEALLSTSADRSVRMTVRGGIIADEDFRTYQIQVTPNGRTLITYKGYLGQPIDNIYLGNNIPAYEQFVYALYRANLIRGTELTGDSNDLRGVCAIGFVYEFQVLKADKQIDQLWTSSCSNARGSLSANVGQLTNLFTAQIPDSQLLIDKLWQ
jgi:hypothetical protein